MSEEAAPSPPPPPPGADPPTAPPTTPPSPPSTPAPLTTLECPRCGYDLTGQSDKRTDDNGTCAECGLTFLWSEVSNPINAAPQWLHEARGGFLRLAKTFARAMVPPLFYGRRGLRLEIPIHWWRITALLVLALLTWFALITLGSRPAAVVELLAGFPELLFWPFTEALEYHGWYWISLVLPVCFAACIPASFLCLGETMRAAKARKIHLLRAALYCVPSSLVIAGLWFVVWDRWGWAFPLRDQWLPDTDLQQLIIPLLGLWLALYWWIVIRCYLRLRRATLIWLLMMIISGLAAFAIVFYGLDWLGEY